VITSLKLLPPIPDEPKALFGCVKYGCNWTGAGCLDRQGVVLNPHGRIKVSPLHPYCASGKCDQGNTIARKFGGVKRRVAVKHRPSPRKAKP
jgi:hypothetical protein